MKENRESKETKKMWSHMHGIVDVADRGSEAYDFPLFYRVNGSVYRFTKDGKGYSSHLLPLLITMEQAEKMGTHPKKDFIGRS